MNDTNTLDDKDTNRVPDLIPLTSRGVSVDRSTLCTFTVTGKQFTNQHWYV